MKVFAKLFPRPSEDNRPIDHPVNFTGSAPYTRSFKGSGFGVIFEDDGETGYFYATDERNSEILDALHLYDVGEPRQSRPEEEVFIV
jgi:hypothetical protein